jgi:CRP/FNR family transcriptional regulator, cyclic AMP receptor protein
MTHCKMPPRDKMRRRADARKKMTPGHAEYSTGRIALGAIGAPRENGAKRGGFHMLWTELLGYTAAGFSLLAYSMRTMLPLRIAAIGSNMFFIAYAGLLGIYPSLFLNLILLPFNCYRLAEIVRTIRQVRAARTGDFDVSWIAQLLPVKRLEDGAALFRKGDAPDNLYFLVSGRVRLAEIGVTLEAGELFGEIAFFSDAHERTLTAVCDGPCEIVRIDERSFMQLYYRNPAFGMYVVRLISRRLLDGMTRQPDAYVPVAQA